MANLNVTHLNNIGRNRNNETANIEGGTAQFDAVVIDSTKRSVAVNNLARVVRLEPEADCHFLMGPNVSSGDVTTGDEVLKTGNTYYKQVDGDETIAIVQT